MTAASSGFAQLISSPGSLYQGGTRFADLTRDLRAADIGDLVTVLVNDKASAISKGTTNTQRKSSANAAVNSLLGPASARLASLLDLTNNQQIQAQGQTSRDMTLSTTVTARVIQVTPGGNFLIEGVKDVGVNSEKQSVSLRGIIRPVDLTVGNTVRSDQIANLNIQVNGKGVVGDAVRRPFILWRLLMGLLPL